MGQVQALPGNGEAGTALGTIQADFEHVCGKASADFEDFFENGGIALHLVGADGTILRANKAELELLGFAAHEYIGRHALLHNRRLRAPCARSGRHSRRNPSSATLRR